MGAALELSSDELVALARTGRQARLLGLAVEAPARVIPALAERGRRALAERGLDAEGGDGPLGVLMAPEFVLRATHRSGERSETRTFVARGERWVVLRAGERSHTVAFGRGRLINAFLEFTELTAAKAVPAAAPRFATTLEALNRATAGDETHPREAAGIVQAMRTRATASEIATLHWEGRRLVGGELTWIDGATAGLWILEDDDAARHGSETPVVVEPVARSELLRRVFAYLPGAPIGPA